MTERTGLRWPNEPQTPRLAFGADYNPEQWPREVWEEDVRAMRQAGVNLVSVAIFSWSYIQPGPAEWDFEWLDDVMDLLHRHGVAVDLATATATPPPWLASNHPEILPVTKDGSTIWPGSRQGWRPTSPVFREYALRLVRAMAKHYADHPALAAWHVSNELGCHNVYDYSDDAAAAFRRWLQDRYGTLNDLNATWATTFWSQRYTEWSQILPPRLTGSFANPGQLLDFQRFSSDALLDYLRAERDVLHAITPDIPVTTNFMVMAKHKGMNYATWAPEVDFVSNDHYTDQGPQTHDELSFSANLTGNLAERRPWLLMEHSTSAVNWQPVNQPKGPGEMLRDSLTHVAHGADGVCFFQWRQSKAGAEKYHSAMIPHAGTDSTVFRRVVDLGRRLAELAEVARAAPSPAPVGIVYDWDSWWTVEADSSPSNQLRYRQEALDWYTACLDLGLRADVITSSGEMADYQILIAPLLHVIPELLATRITDYVTSGGHLITTYYSGIVDESDQVWLGGYPGALRHLLGVRVEEFTPLRADQHLLLDNGADMTVWSERVSVARDVEVLATYRDGPHVGEPAITRRKAGTGSGTYVTGRLGPSGAAKVLEDVAALSGVTSQLPPPMRGEVELAVRKGERSDFWFLISRTGADVLAGDELPGEEIVLDSPDGPGLSREPSLVRVRRVPH